MRVKHSLANCDMVQTSNPPYSPDLTPVDFFLFPAKNLPQKMEIPV